MEITISRGVIDIQVILAKYIHLKLNVFDQRHVHQLVKISYYFCTKCVNKDIIIIIMDTCSTWFSW